MTDIGTVGGLVEYLKILPQDAAVYVADEQTYRSKEDYSDWDERDNVSFPLGTVTLRRGLSAEEQTKQFLERNQELKEQGRARIMNPEMFPPEPDEPEKIVTLVGCR